MLRAMLERATALSRKPEFYNSLTENCTTSLVDHVNALRPGFAPFDWRVILPGYMGEYVHDLGIVDTDLPFAEAMERFRADTAVRDLTDLRDFSRALRSRR
jgi:hypothetical protein